MSTMVERVARALCAANGDNPDGPTCDAYYPDDPDCIYPWAPYRKMARAAIEAMMDPTEEQLDAVRHLVQWHTFGRPTEVALVRHCSALRKEPPEGCSAVDHVPPTNMVSYWIFKGILQAALKEQA